MDLIYTPDCLLHETGSHPECKERLDAFRDLSIHNISDGEQFLELIHGRQYIEQVIQCCAGSIPLDNDTLTCANSYTAACAAVGAGISAADSGGFALVRPPGHHAYPNRASGFCLFNNIAIATRYLTDQGKRVFILDIDGHLGDGTSNIFYQDPKVLFCSLHQYPAFPGTGWVDEIGSGQGQGFTVNVPLPAGSGDDIFWKGIEFVSPIIREFNPDVVAVSAGFDAHINDPLLQLKLSLSCYHRCGKWLSSNFENVFAILEGGYNLEVLPRAINQLVDGFNQPTSESVDDATTSDESVRVKFEQNMERLQQILKAYWAV